MIFLGVSSLRHAAAFKLLLFSNFAQIHNYNTAQSQCYFANFVSSLFCTINVYRPLGL